MAPNSSVKVTHISKQYFVLGQLDGGLETKMASRRSYPLPLAPCGSFPLWAGTFVWPSIWRLAPDTSSTRLLHLAAMDMKLVAVS